MNIENSSPFAFDPAAKVCVVGAGKLGLPVAVHIAQMGHSVIAADINVELVDLVNQGIEPFPGEPELQSRLSEVHAAQKITATTDISQAVSESAAVIILVPLVVDAERQPVFKALDSATEMIAKGLKPGTIVSYETTLPVGTTRHRFAPALAALSGLTVGEDLFVAHSPERVYTGRVFGDLRRYPKLVGGVTASCAGRAEAFYTAVLEFDDRPDLPKPNGVWRLASVETAEMTKLAETTYRNVNIGLANEYARFAESNGINVYDVIEAANSQVFSHIHQPGASVGGHCIPVYPHLYMTNDTEATLPKTSVAANEAMPSYMADSLGEMLGGLTGKSVLIMGLCYRAGAKEDAFSGTYPLTQYLESQGATVYVDDPMYSDDELAARGFTPYTNQNCDGAILHTAHQEYEDWDFGSIPGLQAFIGGRGLTDTKRWHPAKTHILGIADDLVES